MRVKHSRMLPSLFGTSTADTERLGTTAMAEPSHDAPTPNGHDAAGVAGGTANVVGHDGGRAGGKASGGAGERSDTISPDGRDFTPRRQTAASRSGQ